MDQPVFLVQTMVFPFHTDGCYNEIKKSLEDNQQDHYLNQRHIFLCHRSRNNLFVVTIFHFHSGSTLRIWRQGPIQMNVGQRVTKEDTGKGDKQGCVKECSVVSDVAQDRKEWQNR